MATVSKPVIDTAKLIELLTSIGPAEGQYVSILSGSCLAIGKDPFQPTHTIDLSKERVEPYGSMFNGGAAVSLAEQPSHRVHPKLPRRTGRRWYELKGRGSECISLKELLRDGLREIENECPGTLEKLYLIKPRTRRIVARDPGELFDQQHLIEAYAEELMPGWWYGTNNSADETSAWLQRACSCAGLLWGHDFKVSL